MICLKLLLAGIVAADLQSVATVENKQQQQGILQPVEVCLVMVAECGVGVLLLDSAAAGLQMETWLQTVNAGAGGVLRDFWQLEGFAAD